MLRTAEPFPIPTYLAIRCSKQNKRLEIKLRIRINKVPLWATTCKWWYVRAHFSSVAAYHAAFLLTTHDFARDIWKFKVERSSDYNFRITKYISS